MHPMSKTIENHSRLSKAAALRRGADSVSVY